MTTRKFDELVRSAALYPRPGVDSNHVGTLAEALRAGTQLPPLTVCADTAQLIDGWHRAEAYRRVYGKDHDIPVTLKRYASDAERYKDAVLCNNSHGRKLTTYDYSRILARGAELGLTVDELAGALHLTVETCGRLTAERCGPLTTDPAVRVPLKGSVRHLAGRPLTPAQREAMPRLGGANQLFYINQLITFIENDFIDTANERLMERLAHLYDILADVVAPQPAGA